MDKKENSFIGLVGFEFPPKGEKKLLLEKWFIVKVSIYLKPSIDLKSKNVNTENKALQGKIFEFLKSCISKRENGRRMNWLPPNKYTAV